MKTASVGVLIEGEDVLVIRHSDTKVIARAKRGEPAKLRDIATVLRQEGRLDEAQQIEALL